MHLMHKAESGVVSVDALDAQSRERKPALMHLRPPPRQAVAAWQPCFSWLELLFEIAVRTTGFRLCNGKMFT